MMQSKKLWWVGLFAVTFAYVEGAVVVYLRQMYGIQDLILSIPPFEQRIALVELGRELSTLFMLLAVGWAAGKSLQTRLGFAFFAFGLWDVFYYVWLKIFINWPASLLTTDILFLFPLPWWGPVIAPVLIAFLMIVGGILAVIAEDREYKVHITIIEGIALLGGLLVMLYSFMKDALMALPADPDTLSQLRPSTFIWPIYLTGLIVTGFVILRATWPGPQNNK